MYKASTTKKICISFDWHNDREYRNLLSAWNANEGNPLDFTDLTPGAINTDSVSRVKAVLMTQMRAATHTLILVGAEANKTHADSKEIGTRNWIWWEIEQSKAEGNKLIAVKIKSTNPTPDPLLGSGTTWAMSFTLDAIVKAINAA
jgi:hypothetical protein